MISYDTYNIYHAHDTQWYPGDGRVLPLEEALKLVSVFVRQEMRLRVALAAGDAIAVAVAEPTSTGVLV